MTAENVYTYIQGEEGGIESTRTLLTLNPLAPTTVGARINP